jgi:hypothetical protein
MFLPLRTQRTLRKSKGVRLFPSPKLVEPYYSGLKYISIPPCKAQSADFEEILLPPGEVR